VVQTSWSGTQYSIPAVAGAPSLALKAWVTDKAALEIARRGGQDLDALREAAVVRGAKPVPLGIEASGTIAQTVARKTSPNVIGVLRGENASQGVIYTSHYDHLGARELQPGEPPDADRIFNGAADNASGVAGTLEIAEALASARTRPGRSIYVMFTAAEESGLLGAEYFAGRPVLPAAAWAANINIDLINTAGPSRDIVLLGAERSTMGAMASQLAAERNRVVGPDPEPGRGYFFRSDHFPLAKVGIPAISLSEPVEFLGERAAAAKQQKEEYQAKRYHQVDDEMLPTWDYTGAVNDMRFLAELGWRIANAPGMPAYHPDQQFARPRQRSTN
jgi:Zn-dependent M28 family amino/carboxypeptidase